MASAPDDPKYARRRAKSLGLLTFGFMVLVSVVIALTEESLDTMDIVLMLSMPPVLGALAYLVGLHHQEGP